MDDDDKLGWIDAWADHSWTLRTETRGWGKVAAMLQTEAAWDKRGLHWHRVGPGGLNEGHNCPPECTDGKPAPERLSEKWLREAYPDTVNHLVRRHLQRQAAIQDAFLLAAMIRTGTFWIQWAWRRGYRGPFRGRAL